MARIVQFNSYGGSDVLSLDEVEVPPPGAGEVRLAVEAIGLNRAEVMFRNGAYLQDAEFPSRLGYEAAGTIAALGEGVEGWAVGDRVSLVPPLDIARWGPMARSPTCPRIIWCGIPSSCPPSRRRRSGCST